jgi:ABC-type polysaccharide/polyol phosphate export permease
MQPAPIVTFDAARTGAFAMKDLVDGFKRRDVWSTFAFMDIRLKYRRSYLGPLWITLSTGIMVAAFAYVFGSIFKVELGSYLPYVATGMVLWAFISTTLMDSCSLFTSAVSYIRNLSLPLSTHLYRMILRNIILMAHNAIIIGLVYIIYPQTYSANMLLAVPGLVLVTLNLVWMSLFLGVLSSRYRDVPTAIVNLMTVAYLVTPIIWHADLVTERAHIVDFNPFYHLVEVVRAPLLNLVPSTLSYMVVTGMLVVGSVVTLYLYKLKAHRLSYWL